MMPRASYEEVSAYTVTQFVLCYYLRLVDSETLVRPATQVTIQPAAASNVYVH